MREKLRAQMKAETPVRLYFPSPQFFDFFNDKGLLEKWAMPDTYKLQDSNHGFVFRLHFYGYFLWLEWYL